MFLVSQSSKRGRAARFFMLDSLAYLRREGGKEDVAWRLRRGGCGGLKP